MGVTFCVAWVLVRLLWLSSHCLDVLAAAAAVLCIISQRSLSARSGYLLLSVLLAAPWLVSAAMPDAWEGDVPPLVGHHARFFSRVTFTVFALKALLDSDVTVDVVLSCWEAAGTSKEFLELLEKVCAKLPAHIAMAMAAQLKTAVGTGSLAATRIATAEPASFQEAVVDELAVGLELAGVEASADTLREVADKATTSADARMNSEERMYLAIFDSVMYPIGMLAVARKDPSGNMYSKLKSKLVKEGEGEWARHLKTEDQFDEWLDSVISWLLSCQQLQAVERLQKWRRGIALKWNMGGKVYVRLYFNKYHGQFPVTADPELMFKSQAQAMDKFNTQLASQLKLLEKKKKTFACYKCGSPDHAAAKCTLEPAEAKRLKKKKKAAAAAAVAAASADSGDDEASESD
jgi:hypothetical protein